MILRQKGDACLHHITQHCHDLLKFERSYKRHIYRQSQNIHDAAFLYALFDIKEVEFCNIFCYSKEDDS